MNSPHVLDVQNAGLIDGEWAFFVTPFCKNGDMDDVIERTEIGNLKSVKLTCDLLIGIGSLHEKRYLHRDLKPANIYVGDEDQAIIGDFGSIKYLPEDRDSIPASSHAVLYRPPESLINNSFSFSGDIYQSGIVLYQLLGGHLPYDEISWLKKSELKHYNQLTNEADKSMYVDQCIESIIKKGKILNINSLPPWVPDSLKRTIRKATHKNPEKRFTTASAFQVHLNNLNANIPNWIVEDGIPTLRSNTSFKVYEFEQGFVIKKQRGKGQWRRDNSINVNTIAEAVVEINKKASSSKESLPTPRPLRTVRESFPSYGSSLSKEESDYDSPQ